MPYITTAERVGIEKGLAEGLAKGREEGREEGLLTGIKVALEVKFAGAGLALLPESRQIDDVALLQKVLEAITISDSPTALRRMWSES